MEETKKEKRKKEKRIAASQSILQRLLEIELHIKFEKFAKFCRIEIRGRPHPNSAFVSVPAIRDARAAGLRGAQPPAERVHLVVPGGGADRPRSGHRWEPPDPQIQRFLEN